MVYSTPYIYHPKQCQSPLPVRDIPGVVGVEGTDDPGGPEEVVVTVVAVVVVTAEDCWVVEGVRLTGAALGSPLLSLKKKNHMPHLMTFNQTAFQNSAILYANRLLLLEHRFCLGKRKSMELPHYTKSCCRIKTYSLQ